METIAPLYILFFWPATVGWYGAERGLSLLESIVLGLLPMMIISAVN